MMKNYIIAGVLTLSIVGLLTIGFWESESTINPKRKVHTLAKAKKKLTKAKDVPVRKFDGPEKYVQFHRDIRTKANETEPAYKRGYAFEELEKAQKRLAKTKGLKRTSNDMVTAWTERGPANVPGRTRGLIVDPDDANKETWFTGSVGGGVWKTTDAGATWENISPNLPNLATTVIGMADSNHDVIYMGTGEGFGGLGSISGNGMWKSLDRGQTWTHMSNTLDFDDINRLAIDPADENLVVVASDNGIYRTTDGGDNWTTVYSPNGRVQDLKADPSDFNILYASVNSEGVVKSTDKGLTWNDASTGLSGFARIELAIASNNTSILYASAQGGITGSLGTGGASDLYVTRDGGDSWTLAVDNDGNEPDWVEGQGWYDNTIAVNPMNDNIVYAGGVELWKMEVTDELGDPIESVEVNTDETDSFIGFINFGGAYNGGSIDTDLSVDQLTSVEIRFGPGISQKAHRFTVGGQGSGVSPAGYTYEDYVDVPFQVWDVDNNRQLMASFRDQQEDGAFNLIESNTSGDGSTHSREYLFINDVDYSETADENIAQNGGTNIGHEYNQLYFMWSVLAAGATWDPDNLPSSKLEISISSFQAFGRSSIHMTDAQTPFIDGKNGNVHVDQHNIVPIVNGDEVRLLVANDGGIFYTDYGTDPGVEAGTWSNSVVGYNNTQFYGADKRKGADEYMAGAQDNGTWYSQEGETASATSQYTEAFGGDGFETAWHYNDPLKMIGASQFNGVRRSVNGGQSWQSASADLTDNGPFVSRMASSKIDPDVLYVIGSSGVWKSTNFGESWTSKPISDNWGFTNVADVEISLATPQVVWAGAGMDGSRKIHISKDGGFSFEPTNNFDELGTCTAIYSHPTDPGTAFVLFSQAASPKIVKTTDFGQTWEDISGFAGNTVSDRGFPDVAVYSILVMPHATDVIWVGTEIGIFESEDGGASWVYLNSENAFPAVDVWDMKVVDDQVVIATHGRGVWTATIPDLPEPPTPTLAPVIDEVWQPVAEGFSVSVAINLRSSYELTEVFLDDVKVDEIPANAEAQTVELNLTISEEGSYTIKTISYEGGLNYPSEAKSIVVFTMGAPISTYKNLFNETSNDFVGNGYSVATESGFDNGAIHSIHPYTDAEDFVYLLKSPIVVSADNPSFSYNDIAIIEPGEDGTVFGDEQFWDYVIVEASKDNRTWTPLADGYDARANSAWLDAYTGGNPGTPDMFMKHSIDLSTQYAANDVVLIRFRLSADANTNGWGWAIDNVKIQAANEAPTANADNYTDTFEGNVLDNDTDPDGDDIIVSTTLVTEPNSGSVVLNEDGSFVYTPENGFVGTVTFEYKITDNGTPPLESTGTVTIEVELDDTKPQAVDDVFTTTLSGNVLENDFDPNGDNLSVSETLASQPSNGTVTISANGDFTYKPNADFVDGTDSFEYTVMDDATNSLSSTATVTVTVTHLLGFEDDVAANKTTIQSYPNPATTFTNVKYYLPKASTVSIQVFDNNGKMVNEFISDSKLNKGIQEYRLDLNGLKKGLYIVQLSSDNGLAKTKIAVQ